MSKRRRRKGEGSIIQRKDGLFEIVLSLGVGADGKRKRKSLYFKTEAEAIGALSKERVRIGAGIEEPSKMPLGLYMEQWAEGAKSTTARNTQSLCASMLKLNILPFAIASVPLAKLHGQSFRTWFVDLEKAGRSKVNRYIAYALVKRALIQALEDGVLSRSPFLGVVAPSRGDPKRVFWNADQARTFLEGSAKERFYPAWATALLCGMRFGEVLGLQWTDVDFDKRTINVHQQLLEVDGEILGLAPLKTKASLRVITMPHALVTILLTHRQKLLARGLAALPFVFPNKKGQYALQGTVRRGFQNKVEKLGLPMIRFHDLRHTHATLLLRAREHPKVVSSRLGHSKIGITLDLYSHAIQEMDSEAADKIDVLVSTKKA